jgi:probable phosphoglycerate mutase
MTINEEGRIGSLILVRHGQTEANVAMQLDTALPGAPLTPLGIAQAEKLGEALRQRARTGALVSSRALRAEQTAGYAQVGCDVEMQIMDGLHEVQAGDLEGRSDDDAHHQFVSTVIKWHHGNLDARIPGGESAADVFARYLPVIELLRAKYFEDAMQPKDVVIVSHGAAIRLIASHLAKIPGAFAVSNHLDNTQSIQLVPKADGGWECVRWGRISPPFPDHELRGADDPMG